MSDAIIGSIVLVMLAITGWLWRDMKAQLLDVRTEVDDELKSYRHQLRDNIVPRIDSHGNRISILEADQRNMVTQLVEIKSSVRDIVKGIADVMDAIRRGGA